VDDDFGVDGDELALDPTGDFDTRVTGGVRLREAASPCAFGLARVVPFQIRVKTRQIRPEATVSRGPD
jgi:hypothetical protein